MLISFTYTFYTGLFSLHAVFAVIADIRVFKCKAILKLRYGQGQYRIHRIRLLLIGTFNFIDISLTTLCCYCNGIGYNKIFLLVKLQTNSTLMVLFHCYIVFI